MRRSTFSSFCVVHPNACISGLRPPSNRSPSSPSSARTAPPSAAVAASQALPPQPTSIHRPREPDVGTHGRPWWLSECLRWRLIVGRLRLRGPQAELWEALPSTAPSSLQPGSEQEGAPARPPSLVPFHPLHRELAGRGAATPRPRSEGSAPRRRQGALRRSDRAPHGADRAPALTMQKAILAPERQRDGSSGRQACSRVRSPRQGAESSRSL